MTLPTFLGVGAPRCGSTWLHDLLDSHPDVYVPTRRKEVRFFDVHYERGLDWYKGFFPSEEEAACYRAIGEFSPTYLSCPECPNRIAGVPSITHLIVILRNPVDRAYSRYGFHVRYEGFDGTFEDLIATEPYIIDEGYYSQGIQRFLTRFARERMLVLIYERAIDAYLPDTKARLADFLSVPIQGFLADAGTRRVNVGSAPKRGRTVYAWLTTVTRRFQERDVNVDWAVRLAKMAGLRSLFGDMGKLSPMRDETRQHLERLYEEEVVRLENMLQVDLSCWH